MPVARCAMHMLWNTQIINTCVVFPQWHITSYASFIISLVVVAGLGVLFEYLRASQRALDTRIALLLRGARRNSGRPISPPTASTDRDGELGESEGLITTHPSQRHGQKLYAVPPVARIARALLYALMAFLSFFLMLIFMTYNAYLILAVVAGAGLGHYIFGSHMDADFVINGHRDDARDVGCH